MKTEIQIAVFGGGCFWCTEAVFERLEGAVSVTSGYAGGSAVDPTYEQVSSGRTGHAEVIRIEYDPKRLSFPTLLSVFFTTHDPTTPNQQGADVGSQYRSIILYATEEQRREARKFMEELESSHTFDAPLTTELRPLDKFYEAEEYHKQYYRNNPDKPYCQVVINPKLKKLKERYANLLKKDSGFTLVELLTVIGIIGLAAGIVLVATGGARVRARDVTRKSDLAQIGRFLYASSCYPPSGGGGDYDLADLLPELQAKYPQYAGYASMLPRDPTGSDTKTYYHYSVELDASHCVLYANLENPDEAVTIPGITTPTGSAGAGVFDAQIVGWNGGSKYYQVGR